MSEVITNMKVRFGADTKQFKKGMDDGKRATQQFKRDAGGALDSFAAAFGVNMFQLRKGMNAFKTSLLGLGGGFKTAAGGANIFTKALKILKLALISTGIGAIVVALGSLIAYFTNTQRGADKVSQVFKAIGAITDVLVDRLSAFGETIAKAFTDPKQAVADLWEAIKTNIVNRFEGLIILFQKVGQGMKALWKRDWDELKTVAGEAGQAIIQLTTGFDNEQQKKFADGFKGIATEIKEEAKAAAILEAASQRLRDKEISLIEIQAKRRREIAAARLLAENDNIAAEKRLAAMTRAIELENKTLEENKELQREKIRIMQAEVDLGESMTEDYRALAEEKAKLEDIEAASLKMQKRLQTEINSLTIEINSNTAAIIKNREAQTGDLKPIESKKLSIDLDTKGLELDKLADNLKTGLEPAQNVILDFADTFNSTFNGLAVSFGESMGALLAGTSGFDGFGKMILGTLGGLAIQVGKMAIGTGIAIKGIKTALTSLNPVVAIAGGIALVALGSMIKNSLSSAASGGGGGTYSSNTGGGGTFDTRTNIGATSQVSAQAQPVAVHITGEFRQRGADMVAAIEETNSQKRFRR